jgi:hypothetical protein
MQPKLNQVEQILDNVFRHPSAVNPIALADEEVQALEEHVTICTNRATQAVKFFNTLISMGDKGLDPEVLERSIVVATRQADMALEEWTHVTVALESSLVALADTVSVE